MLAAERRSRLAQERTAVVLLVDMVLTERAEQAEKENKGLEEPEAAEAVKVSEDEDFEESMERNRWIGRVLLVTCSSCCGGLESMLLTMESRMNTSLA